MFDTCACFLTFSCEDNHAWITRTQMQKEWVLRKSSVCPTYTAESLLTAVGELRDEHKWEQVLQDHLNMHVINHSRIPRPDVQHACMSSYVSCKCNHAWLNMIKYISNQLHRPIFPKTDHAQERSSNHAKNSFRSHVDWSTVCLLADVNQLHKTSKWEQVRKHHFKSQERQSHKNDMTSILHDKFMQESWLRCIAPLHWAREWLHSQRKH